MKVVRSSGFYQPLSAFSLLVLFFSSSLPPFGGVLGRDLRRGGGGEERGRKF